MLRALVFQPVFIWLWWWIFMVLVNGRLLLEERLWGDLVESMNSRQREARVAGEAKRRRLCGPQAGASTIKEHSVPAQRMLEMVRVELWKRVSEQESPLLDTLPRKRAE